MAPSSSTNKLNLLIPIIALSLYLLTSSGCQMIQDFGTPASPMVVAAPAKPTATKTCVDPRPKICTMRYQPVCAVMETGRITTYPSACNACADIAVSGWRPEPCEEL